ncbi:MAG: small multi-drug export protein, partial [Clostridia bacterium]
MANIIMQFAEFLENLFHSRFLAVLFTSMLPVVEVRGGIPLGLSLGMSPTASYFSACLAGLIVVPIILIFLKKVIFWLCKSEKLGNFGRSLNTYFFERAQKVENGAIVSQKSNLALKYLALYLFVAAPLPLTGFWTGTAIAVFMNLNPLKSFLTITIGNLTAGGLVLLLSLVLGDKSYIVLAVFMALVPVVFGILAYKLIKKRKSISLSTNNTSAEKDIENNETDI